MDDQPIRVLVTGSRDWKWRDVVWDALDSYVGEAVRENRHLIVVHGACPSGADAMADIWVHQQPPRPPWPRAERHPAQNHPTEDFGPWPRCGPRRNNFMVKQNIDACLAFIGFCSNRRCQVPGPHPSHGAYGCAHAALKAGIPVTTYSPNGLDIFP